jgi:hypothetical protein
MLFHVGYAATFFCETSCYHLPIYAKVSSLAFFWIFPISYFVHGDCYVVMVIFIYTKLGALNMVIRMTENVRSLWKHWSHCWGSVHIPLRRFNINQVLIQRRNISEVLFRQYADSDGRKAFTCQESWLHYWSLFRQFPFCFSVFSDKRHCIALKYTTAACLLICTISSFIVTFPLRSTPQNINSSKRIIE